MATVYYIRTRKTRSCNCPQSGRRGTGHRLEPNQITDKKGVKIIIDRLNKIYKKDELTQKYNAVEVFETYRQQPNLTIRDFLTEFEKRHHKNKSYGITISDEVLAYRLLKAANLPTRDEQLVKATITELKYDSVKSKLIKIFSDNSDAPTPELNDIHIKTEPVYHTQSYPEDNAFDQTSYANEDPEFQHKYIYENDNERQNEHHTLYARNNKHTVRKKATSHTNNFSTWKLPAT